MDQRFIVIVGLQLVEENGLKSLRDGGSVDI